MRRYRTAIHLALMMSIYLHAQPLLADEHKTLSIGTVKPFQARAAVEMAVGQPLLSDPQNHIYHYPKSLIVIYDPADNVLNVHGPWLEINGHSLGEIIDRQDVEHELGAGTMVAGEKGYSSELYPRYGLTVYLHGDNVDSFLLEQPHGR